MTAAVLFQLILGLAILTTGAELLIRGSSRLAAAAGISPLVIGLTVVAYGTSTPELAVSVKSAWAGQADIALGNVVGSNIFNVLFILGACAIILPLTVHIQLIRLDVPLMIAVSAVLYPIAYDGVISRFEGALLCIALVSYTVFIIRKSRAESRATHAEYAEEFDLKPTMTPRTVLKNTLFLIVGVLGLVLGARWFVNASIEIATAFGVSELVIGLTIVAVGTSLPEVATSIVASLRGERDIAIGNVVGSNIYNILAVLGMTSLVKPIAVPAAALSFDIPVMIAVCFACLPVFITGMSINRWEGAVFLLYYVAYTTYLVLKSQSDDRLPQFGQMMVFVIPLTVLTLGVLALREWRVNRAANAKTP